MNTTERDAYVKMDVAHAKVSSPLIRLFISGYGG